MTAEPEDVTFRFVDAINHADLNRLSGLMTEDHTFVDSDGTEIVGRHAVVTAWSSFFSMVREYRVVVDQSLSESTTVVLLGTATGAFLSEAVPSALNRWTVPAAWRVVIEGDCVALWQVYVNPEPITNAMKRAKEKR